jgi:hypothetical protein
MKKLLIISIAVFVSVMGCGAELASAGSNEGLGIPYTLNPYAYDLNSTWDEVSQQLTVHFKLNSPPNLNDGLEMETIILSILSPMAFKFLRWILRETSIVLVDREEQQYKTTIRIKVDNMIL